VDSAGGVTGVSVGVDSGEVGVSVSPSAVVIPTKMPDVGAVTDGTGSDGSSLVRGGMTLRGRPSEEPGGIEGKMPSEGIGGVGSRVVSGSPPVPVVPIMKGPTIVEEPSPLGVAGGLGSSGVGAGGIIVSGSPLADGDEESGAAVGPLVGASEGSSFGSVGRRVVKGKPPVERPSASGGTLRVSGLSGDSAGVLGVGETITGGRGPPVTPTLGTSDGSSDGRDGRLLLGRSAFGGETGSGDVVDG
jgi:hypothetical protein